MVNSDLRSLQNASGVQQAFVGGLDLVGFARDRSIISDARCSLSDICARVLNMRLDKNVSERLSNQWENENLTSEQISYAARDAYISLILYHELSKIPVPSPLPAQPNAGLPIQIYQDDSTRLIAYGRTVDHTPSDFHGITLNKHRVVVEITTVLVPGAKLSIHKSSELRAFGPAPFNVVVRRSRVKVAASIPLSESTPAITNTPTASPSTITSIQPPVAFDTINGADDVANLAPSPDQVPLTELMHDAQMEDSELQGPSRSNQSRYEIDPSSRKEGEDIFGTLSTVWPSVMRSRVLKDPFHVFKMFYISRAHGLRFDFMNALRDAIFIPNVEDRRRIEAWGATLSPQIMFEDLKKQCPDTLWKHCRRIIPPPELLYSLVKQVFDAYGPLRDAQTGRPLFDSNNWKVAKNVLELIRLGQLSDPPGISLYTHIGHNSSFGGLPVYRCSRGTNQTEGGVHTHLRPRLPTSGAGVPHVNASLMDFSLRHNLLASSKPSRT